MGKDCRKRNEVEKIRADLDGRCDVIEMRCVGICQGPVVVAHLETETPVVFKKIRGKKDRKNLRRLLDVPSAKTCNLEAVRPKSKKHRSALKGVRRALRA